MQLALFVISSLPLTVPLLNLGEFIKYRENITFFRIDPIFPEIAIEPLTKPEYGCYLAHRSCWQRFIASNDSFDFAIVLESDALPSSSFYSFVVNLTRLPFVDEWFTKEPLLLLLGRSKIPHFSFLWRVESSFHDLGHLVCLAGFNFKLSRESSTGTVGYLLSRQAALQLLDNFPVCRADDYDLMRKAGVNLYYSAICMIYEDFILPIMGNQSVRINTNISYWSLSRPLFLVRRVLHLLCRKYFDRP